MSALKKQTSVRWSHRNELSTSGHIIATVWSVSVGGFYCEITNYPGTSTLDWSITKPGTDWWSGGDETRHEYTVATLKDRVFTKALEYANRQNPL